MCVVVRVNCVCVVRSELCVLCLLHFSFQIQHFPPHYLEKQQQTLQLFLLTLMILSHSLANYWRARHLQG